MGTKGPGRVITTWHEALLPCESLSLACNQHATQNLPGRGFGNHVDEFKQSDLFVWRDVLRNERNQLLRQNMGIWLENHKCFGYFAGLIIGTGNYCRVSDRGM